MKVSRIKEIIKECLVESFQEIANPNEPQMVSADPVKSGIDKLKKSSERYPSFFPDVITYMKNPEDNGATFVVVAKESDKHQYIRLSVGLPEQEAKRAVVPIKDFLTKSLEANVKSGKYKINPDLQRGAQVSLSRLKTGTKSGDTGMMYKGSLKEMHYFPSLNAPYYASQNLKIPKLSRKYTLYYKHMGNGYYIEGYAEDADQFDHYAYRIHNGIGTKDQADLGVYTNPPLNDRDKREIEKWSSKEEVKQRREFEKKNFPANPARIP